MLDLSCILYVLHILFLICVYSSEYGLTCIIKYFLQVSYVLLYVYTSGSLCLNILVLQVSSMH